MFREHEGEMHQPGEEAYAPGLQGEQTAAPEAKNHIFNGNRQAHNKGLFPAQALRSSPEFRLLCGSTLTTENASRAFEGLEVYKYNT